MLNGNIAVVFGGVSNESEISVITGTMALNVLKKGGVNALPVYISMDGRFCCDERLADINEYSSGDFSRFANCVVADGGVYILKKGKKIKKFIPLRAAINCCHGGIGEGGGLCGLFGFAKIPLAGAGMYASSAFMDKSFTKLALKALDIPVLPYAEVRSSKDIPEAIEKIGFPLVVKPACLGSSIGVSVANDERELSAAVGVALAYDKKAVCEPYLKDKREINVAVCCIGGEAVVSDCEEAFSSDCLLTFDDKYTGGGKSQFPADLPPDMAESIKNMAKDVYLKTEMRGVARFDFLLSGENVYLSEVNTVPGSLAYYLNAKSFKEFFPVLVSLIEQAIADFEEAGKKRVIATGILRGIKKGGKGVKT
ncbi:MAG: ATP-grasp domain-containing protein [Clostridia bacterium]|nr:ATP-grasp domain-containing protein [Clostridia bacterium]